jgi:hypothetical protein
LGAALARDMTPHPERAIGIWAGCIAAPLLWFTQQVLAGALVQTNCTQRGWIVPTIWAVCSALVIAATGLSWRARRRATPRDHPVGFTAQRQRFVGWIGGVMPLIFLVAMTWQAAATLVYSGCER